LGRILFFMLFAVGSHMFAIGRLQKKIGAGRVMILRALLYGIGALFTVSAPYVGEYFGMEQFGAVFGLIFTAFGFIAGILGPWFGGYLLGITGGHFAIVFCYFGSLMLIAAALIRWWTPHTECRM
jgi:OFA family oxalate/formate antiporter-like MFS transporter